MNILTMLYKKFAGLTSFPGLHPFISCPHFPFSMTHFTGSMPISSIGGIWSAAMGISKYALHVYKVTVAVDMSG